MVTRNAPKCAFCDYVVPPLRLERGKFLEIDRKLFSGTLDNLFGQLFINLTKVIIKFMRNLVIICYCIILVVIYSSYFSAELNLLIGSTLNVIPQFSGA